MRREKRKEKKKKEKKKNLKLWWFRINELFINAQSSFPLVNYPLIIQRWIFYLNSFVKYFNFFLPLPKNRAAASDCETRVSHVLVSLHHVKPHDWRGTKHAFNDAFSFLSIDKRDLIPYLFSDKADTLSFFFVLMLDRSFSDDCFYCSIFGRQWSSWDDPQRRGYSICERCDVPSWHVYMSYRDLSCGLQWGIVFGFISHHSQLWNYLCNA